VECQAISSRLNTVHGSARFAPGYEVIRVPLTNGKASGFYEDFPTGFVLENRDVWGRPVGVAALPDGSLLVLDDATGILLPKPDL
jgi:glucose/arabinose dehydrogenase